MSGERRSARAEAVRAARRELLERPAGEVLAALVEPPIVAPREEPEDARTFLSRL